MNLRLHVLMFLALGASSTVVSANWFDDYNANEKVEDTSVEVPVVMETQHHQEEISSTQAVSSVSNSFLMTSYYKNPMSVYFLPQAVAPKVINLAPSFDVVAREMEQIKQQQIADEHALITYLQDKPKVSVE